MDNSCATNMFLIDHGDLIILSNDSITAIDPFAMHFQWGTLPVFSIFITIARLLSYEYFWECPSYIHLCKKHKTWKDFDRYFFIH